MALVAYHCNLGAHSRSKGQSATAGAAYRAGERVVDERTGIVHDYTRRRGIERDESGNLAVELLAPKDAPEWAYDRATVWNESERANNRKNSTVAREFKMAFPADLSFDARREMIREFCKELVAKHGVVVDYAMHLPDRRDGEGGHNRNYHAHVLMSTHRIGPEGFTEKSRELDDRKTGPELTVFWKKTWAEKCARELDKAGLKVEAERWRYGYLSKDEQLEKAKERGDTEYVQLNEDRIPGVHLGRKVIEMEQRGIRTERGDVGRDIAQRNAQIINLAEARQRIEAARAAYERNNGNGRDRTTDRVTGRDVTRAGGEQPGRVAGKSDIGRPGHVPPAFARGRLRNLSELGVVRFPERSEVLLPRDVPRNVEHERAEPDHALRRADNGLTGEKPNARELIQRELNADLLRRAVADREPIKAANDPSPDAIKQEWQNEKARQFTLIVNRAKVLHSRAAGQMERQEGKLQAIDQQRPAEPTGLLANFKKAAHDQALSAWRGVRSGLERRWSQLQRRLTLIGDYMRKAGPYEQPTRGERLAEKKAAEARPELAANFQQVIEKEKAARIAAQRAKIDQRRTGKHQEHTMKQESIEELKQRIDTNREKADKAERNELDKAGRLAGMQRETNAEQQYEENQTGKTQAAALAKELNSDNEKGDQAKEAKKREILERFKQKASRDRENDRSRGR
ncbi:MobQ family relaxase [Vibrio cholerae]|uniref:MobQ family relaxase n=1 Tax=Vibrio cholerae TaxID=666 RepID=UPI0030183EE9